MLHLLATCLLLTSTVGIADDTWWSCQPLTQPNIPGDESDGHPIDRFLAGPMQDLHFAGPPIRARWSAEPPSI